MILVGYLPIPKKLMEQSDFVVGNLETPLAGKQTNTNPCFKLPICHSAKCFLKAGKLDKSIENHKEKTQIRAERVCS